MRQPGQAGGAIETTGMVLLVAGACCPVAWHGVDAGLAGLALLAGRSLWLRGRRLAAPPWLPVLLLAWCGLALVAMAPEQRAGGLKEWLQWGCILLGGWAAGSGLGTEDRRRFGAVATIGLLASVALGLVQVLLPGVTTGLVAALHGAPYGAGGNGPDLAEELVLALQRSHLQYCAMVCIALPFALVRLRDARSRFALLLLCAWTVLPAPFLALVAGIGACLLLAREEGRQWRRALVLVAVVLVATLRPGPSALEWVAPNLPAAAGPQPKRLRIEHQAALAAAARRPFGYGPGTYRESVRRARIEADLPRPTQKRVRRDGNGQFLVLAIETGAVGAALLAAHLLLTLWRGRREQALAAALAALFAAALATGILGRGIGPLAGFLLGLARAEGAASGWRKALAQATLLVLAVGTGLAWPYREPMANVPDVGLPNTTERIWVEAEAAATVHPAWRVEPEADAGANRALRIPLGTGQGVGSATYRLVSPAAGRWKLWLRARWSGGCANSVLVSVDGSSPATVEDAIFGRWHWVDVHPNHTFPLPEGEFDLVLASAEDDVAIDQIAFLPDPGDVPLGIFGTEGAAEPPPAHEWDFDEEPPPQERSFDKYRD